MTFPGSEQEGHSVPSFIVHPHPGCDERLGPRVARYPLRLPVTLVLAHDHVGVGEGSKAANDLFPLLRQALSFEAVRWIHRHFSRQLHEVCHQHVEDGSRGLVERRPHRDVERLGYVYLNTFDVRSIPGPGEEAIGKAQDVNVLGRLFPEEMVDPVDLRLLERLVRDAVEFGERLQGGAERLLVDHPRALGQVVGADSLRSEGQRLPAGQPCNG